MHFKHPEILYFLAFLIIPILVHLFQLQRFKKTPFTNVAFLQKLIHETRKSSIIKKWLILVSRLLLFSAIIIAFSQPYFSNKKAEQIQHNFIYLDNSLSTNSKGEKGNLLQNAIKEIIENANQQEIFSLLTNSNFYKNINYSELKKLLLNVNSEAISLSLNEVLLKFEGLNKNKFKTSSKVFLLSDYQSSKKIKKEHFTNVKSSISFIKLQNTQKSNLSIDSVYTQNSGSNNFTLHVRIQNQGEAKNNIPISLYRNETVFSKQTFSIKKNETKSILFPIQNIAKFNGKIILNFSDAFPFDNSFFFNLNSTQKTNVFLIGNSSNFTSKIYSKNEFNFVTNTLQNINYNLLEKQDLIILNELTQIPISLSTFLQKHISQQKSLVIIPNKNININSYNSFFQKLKVGSINLNRKDSAKITDINYHHPFFKNVFSKKVTNFQYPTVKSYYTSQLNNSSSLLNFDNQSPFLSKLYSKSGNIYWFSSSLNTEISNFINSPLVVPVFYNFGKLSAQQPQLYYRIGENNKIDIPTKISKNQVLKLKRNNKEFIPLQQSYTTKVSIQTKEQPKEQGFYEVINDSQTIENLAFNYSKSESLLNFLNISELIKENPNLSYSSSVEDVFQKNLEKNKVTWLWKWFLALAIVSLLFEILILKFFKP